jgi:hypothetical protein
MAICSKCDGVDLRRSHRRNRVEMILSWIGILPWRCRDCGERFLRFMAAERNALPKDHRKLDRSLWQRLPVSTRLQIAGYGAGIALTLVFFAWLAWGSRE